MIVQRTIRLQNILYVMILFSFSSARSLLSTLGHLLQWSLLAYPPTISTYMKRHVVILNIRLVVTCQKGLIPYQHERF